MSRPDLKLATIVRVPDAESPEGKLFRALQAIFDEMSGQADRPTPMNRRRLHEAARSAVDSYFADKLASTAVRYPRTQSTKMNDNKGGVHK